MNGVKEWSAILCLAALASCMLEMVIPTGRMEKIMRFVLGAFLLCAIISPISRLDFSFQGLDISASGEAQSFAPLYQQQMVNAAKDNIEAMVGRELSTEKIPYKKVDAVMDTSNADSIGISKLVVTLDNPEDKVRTQDLLQSKLQIQTEVVCDEK